MSKKKYEVLDGHSVIATNMSLDVAFCLIKGYIDKYFNKRVVFTIREMEPAEGKQDVG